MYTWNSLRDFSIFGISIDVKEAKKTPSKILLSHPACFMTLDAINRYLSGCNIFNVYDEKMKMRIANSQNDELLLRHDINEIVDKYFSVTNNDFISKVDNKFGIQWQYITVDNKLDESLFARSSRFVNINELNKYVNEKDEVSDVAYLVFYLLKDKQVVRKDRVQFIDAIFRRIELMKQPDKPLIDFGGCDPAPTAVGDSPLTAIAEELESAATSFTNERLSQLETKVDQLYQVMMLMKKEIDQLKNKHTPEQSILADFGY